MKAIGILLLVLHILACEANFIKNPHHATQVQGLNATFHCVYTADDLLLPLTWTLTLSDGRNLDHLNTGHSSDLEELGIVITINGDNNIEMTMLASAKTNRTTINCRASTLFGNAFSQGSLKVLGPPSPPEPVLTAVNNTLLSVSWPPPFTWPNHSITHYSISLTNTTDNSVRSWTSNETEFYIRGQEMEEGCDVLVMNITASSDIGEGEIGQVTGGFPIAPGPVELMDCDACKVTFLNDGTPMYAFKFKLPRICSYQTATYEVWLYGLSISGDPILLTRSEYSSSDRANPVFRAVESGLMINHTYSIDVVVYNSEGNTSTNFTFSTEFVLPSIFDREDPVTAAHANIPIMIGGIVISAMVVIALITVILIIVCLYKRKRRSAVAEMTKIIMEGRHISRLGGPYTREPENGVYESIDGFQEENFKKFDLSPACPPRKTPSLPPPRDEYNTGGLQVPQIMVNGENKNGSNPYLQIVPDNNNSKLDPEVRSTGSGEYTTMKSVSLRQEGVCAVNALATQTPQGFNEDNYMVFMEQGENSSKC